MIVRNALERIWEGDIVAQIKYVLFGNFLEELRDNTRIAHQVAGLRAKIEP